MFEKPAIYLIEHTPSGLVYVGGAANLSKRWSRHRSDLRKGVHSNPRLQAAWNADGPASFRWRCLAVVPRRQLTRYEQRALDHFGPDRLLNLHLTAGVNRTNSGKAWTSERRAHMAGLLAKPTPGFRGYRPGDTCMKGHTIDGSRTRPRTRRDGSPYEALICQVCDPPAPPRRRRQIGDTCAYGHVIDGSRTSRNKLADGSYGEPILRCQECRRNQR